MKGFDARVVVATHILFVAHPFVTQRYEFVRTSCNMMKKVPLLWTALFMRSIVLPNHLKREYCHYLMDSTQLENKTCLYACGGQRHSTV